MIIGITIILIIITIVVDIAITITIVAFIVIIISIDAFIVSSINITTVYYNVNVLHQHHYHPCRLSAARSCQHDFL